MEKLEALVGNSIICGVSVDDLPTISPRMDNEDEKTPGYCPIFSDSSSETLDNPDSDALLRSLVEIGALGSKLGQSEVIWDREKCTQWLSYLQEAWKLVFCLIHTTCGSPVYSSEACAYQISNSEDQSRHLHTIDQRFAIVTNYARGNSKYSRKHVYLIPKRLSRIIQILLRVVRPLELYFLLDFDIEGGKEWAALEAHKTFLFVTSGKRWKPEDLQSQLSVWFKQGLGVSLTFNTYKRLFELIHGKQIQGCVRDPIAEAADKQTGHHPLASDHSYARLHGTSQLNEHQWNLFSRESECVQDWFGF